MEIRILLPGLLGPLPVGAVLSGDVPAMPGLAGLLAYADRRTGAAWDWPACLFADFGYARDFPLAACSYLADFGVLPAQPCWRCDPVFLQADIASALLFDSRYFSITDYEGIQLTSVFNNHFVGDGLRLVFRDPRRWYLLADKELPAIDTALPEVIAGGNLGDCLPGGPGATMWNRILNETQMLFFQHDVNAQRESRRERPVNGVWIYGQGKINTNTFSEHTQVYTDDVLCKGLAKQAGIAVSVWPDQWDTGMLKNQRVLVYSNVLQDALSVGDYPRWHTHLSEWDRRVFVPLLEIVRVSDVSCLIDPGNGYQYSVGASLLRRWCAALHFRKRSFESFVEMSTEGSSD